MFNRFFLEWRMQSPLFMFAVNLALIPIIFFTATIGGELGIKGIPLEFSLVWPATGFSLAAILLFGFKVLPGIFLGNFLYNFSNLYHFDPVILANFIAASFVSLGSTFQAFLGGYIIRKYTVYEYFSTLKDILIFLIPAGLLTCIVSSTIGNFTIFFYGGLIEKDIFYTWLTFWIGDLMGIYIFTPLLVVWCQELPTREFKKHSAEAVFLLLLILIVSYATFGLNYRLTHLYLPFCLWAAYRFSMHGATLAVFLTSLITVILTSLGYGPFVAETATIDPLLFLVSFLEVIVATSLIFAAVLKEREESRLLVEKKNLDLEEEVNEKLEEIRDIYHEMFFKEKQTSLWMMTFEVTKQILSLLNEIREAAKQNDETINKLKENLKYYADNIPSKQGEVLLKGIKNIEKLNASIIKDQEHANRIAKLIQEHIAQSSKEKLEVKTVNLHAIINNCLEKAREEIQEMDETFSFQVEKKFDRNVTVITALPWELAYAFNQFINHALLSLWKKWKHVGEIFVPKLEIHTVATHKGFSIVIKDNGKGEPKAVIEKLFQPFTETDVKRESRRFGLFLAYNIIVNIHHGEIHVESEEEQFFQIETTLPRSPYIH